MRPPPRRPVATLLCAALLLVPAVALAEPVARHTWDSFDNLEFNKNWAGPGTYAQTLSVEGVSGTINGFDALLVLGYGMSPAWSFFDGGCQGAARLSAPATVAGCEPIPGTVVQTQLFPHLTDPSRWYLGIQGSIDPPLVADPTKRYGLVTLQFDHSQSVAGAAGPGCTDADAPYCLHLSGVTLYGSVATFVTTEPIYLRWNDPLATDGCAGPTPVGRATWGRIKTLYR